MNKTEIPAEPLAPRIYVNGFPKSGTHLALLLIAALAKPQTNERYDKAHWFGSFLSNSFSQEWKSTESMVHFIKGQPGGSWLKGHCGYKPELEQAFREMGTCMIFVYRDLRDVAVSLTYHVEGSNEQYAHSERELFAELSTHEERLLAVINGLGKDPGIVARWELYAPWLNVDWVLPIRFGDIIADREAAAHRVLQYIIKRTAAHGGYKPMVIKAQYDKMIAQAMYYMDRPAEYSPTYRKGKTAGWRHEFGPEHIDAFIDTGGEDWLRRLDFSGFEHEEINNVRTVEVV